MSLTTFLQIFVLVDVLLIGLLAPYIFRHARAHFKPEEHLPADQTDATGTIEIAPKIPDDVKARMLKASEAKFEETVVQAISELHNNLGTTTTDINNLIKKLAVEVVNEELEQYRQGLAKMHADAEKDMGGFKNALDSHKAELQTKLAAEMKQEKDRLLKQIDTKLGDAVSSFLLDTLGHNVDLGSQSAYIMSVLEEHKAEFAKEVDDETPAS